MILRKTAEINITIKEKTVLQLVARSFVEATDEQVEALLKSKEFVEIIQDERNT
jgi:hypothetical protein